MCHDEDGGVFHIVGGCHGIGGGNNELGQGQAGADVFTAMHYSAPRGQHQNSLVLVCPALSAQSLHGAAHTRIRCIDAEFLTEGGPPSSNGK